MVTDSQPQETPEYRTFREHYDRLYHAIQDPLSLATRLFSQGVITSAVKEQMSMLGLSRLEKNNVFLGAVEMKIQTDASVLHVFLATLNEDSSMQSLAESMQSKCLICKMNHCHSLIVCDPIFLELGAAVKLVYREQNDKNGLLICVHYTCSKEHFVAR